MDLNPFPFLLLIPFSIPSPGSAEVQRPVIQVGGAHFIDSEDFVHNISSLTEKFRLFPNLFAEARFSRNMISKDKDQIQGSGLRLLVGDTLGDGLEIVGGAEVINYEEMGTHLSLLASIAFKPTKTSHLLLRVAHENIVYKVLSLDALREDIESNELSSSFYQWISEKWSFWGRIILDRYSDANRKSSLEGSLTYLVIPNPELDLTYAFGYLDYENRSERYWDPEKFQSHSLLLGMREGIGDEFSFHLRGSLGYLPSEERISPGLSVKVALEDSPHWRLGLSREYLGGGRRDENYSSSTISLDFEYRLSSPEGE